MRENPFQEDTHTYMSIKVIEILEFLLKSLGLDYLEKYPTLGYFTIFSNLFQLNGVKPTEFYEQVDPTFKIWSKLDQN